MKPVFIFLACLVLLQPWVKAQNKLPELFPVRTDSPSYSVLYPIVTSRVVRSENVNDDFKLYISLPPNYDSLRSEKYPVVYFLDGGGGSFHTINYQYMEQGLIPEVITIGIGYPGTSRRDRDYTYGFINFYKFLKQELIPQMDQEFNIDPNNRTLFGHSYGGICVLFTMFEYYHYDDILFRNLIAASPSIWYPDGQLAYKRERTLYGQTHILPVNLYMTVGSMEGSMVSDLNRMQQTLIGHNYDYFNMSCHIYEGKDHSTNKEISYREGVQWVLAQEIRIPTQTPHKLLAQQPIATTLYPNPATDQLNLVIANAANQQVITGTINDGSGKMVKTFEQKIQGQPVIHIPVGELSKGLYTLQLANGHRRQTLKFIK